MKQYQYFKVILRIRIRSSGSPVSPVVLIQPTVLRSARSQSFAALTAFFVGGLFVSLHYASGLAGLAQAYDVA